MSIKRGPDTANEILKIELLMVKTCDGGVSAVSFVPSREFISLKRERKDPKEQDH